MKKLPQNISDVNIEYDRFGFPVDTFKVVKGEVKRNQFLADILIPNKISLEKINEIYDKAKTYFDFRKIQPGNKYRFYTNQDSSGSITAFVFEINQIEYLIINLNDSLKVDYVKRETEIVERTISGVINYSLYQTFIDMNLSPLLAGKLAEVFAWQIDFYTIQKMIVFYCLRRRKTR